MYLKVPQIKTRGFKTHISKQFAFEMELIVFQVTYADININYDLCHTLMDTLQFGIKEYVRK